MDTLTQTLSILDKLVACPTVSGAANRQINDYVADALSGNGTRITRIPSPLGGVEGLIASVGPEVSGGIILSGHSDVVPADSRDWSGDPFRLRVDNEKLFGRGTTDMKGFVACAMALMQDAKADRLTAPVHLFLSADEETTCQSVQSLIAYAKANLPPVRGVVVGEPTLMQPVDQHKASASHVVDVTGKSVHASIAHTGVSATALAARLIVWLEEETARNADTAGDSSFDPAYSTHTVGVLRGGSAGNTLADHCRFTWDIRLMPEEKMTDVLARFDSYADLLVKKLRKIAPETAVSRTCAAYFPGLASLRQGVFRDEVLRVSRAQRLGAVPYGTEAGFFQESGLETVVLGPGSIAQAHTVDEYVESGQLAACIKVTKDLMI